MIDAGVGLYAHIVSRKRRQSSVKSVKHAKEAEAEAGKAATKSTSSQPPMPIVQSQQPLGGLFEPVGCPRLGTPCGHEPHSFIQSITSSNRSRSKMSGSLRSYPAAVMPSMVSLQADSFNHHQEGPKQAQHTLANTCSPATNSQLNTAVVTTPSNVPAQRAQQAFSSFQTQPAEQAEADEALCQEAAAAEDILDSFSRA